MKKLSIALLLSLSCACTVIAATACDDEPETPPESCTFTLQAGEGYSFVGDGISYDAENDCWRATATKNEPFSFQIELGAFYTGTPTLTVDNVALPSRDGVYTLTAQDNLSVAVSGVREDVSSMVGSGAFDDAFVVSKPIDLLYIAEKVNSGDKTYANASYILANDIDCKGEEIDIIGDSEENFFSGCFTCLTNSETGEMARYTISNFKINSSDSNYVGLFGCVQADMTVSGSGLFYGIRLENFEINANVSDLNAGDRSVYCGGLIGYATGVRTLLCDAVGGEINLASDASEFSFVGGLIGVQQGFYLQEYDQFFYAETAYASVDVDVTVVRGTALYAGGIAGYLYTNSFYTPSFIHNSYATGDVSGALRTGGIVGGLGQYTSIATSYSTGDVVAKVAMTSQTDGFLPEYCIAYAGGIAGFAENDTVVNDSFVTGTQYAEAADGETAEFTHFAIGGGDAEKTVSVASCRYLVLDCINNLDLNTVLTTLTAENGWQDYNWVIEDKKYPTINYAAAEDSTGTSITVKYVNGETAVNVDGANNKVFPNIDPTTGTYAPISDSFLNGTLSVSFVADDRVSLSYGYFFDSACTQPVPYSYLPTKNVDIYVGFINPADIVGTYLVATNSATPVVMEITANGKIEYSDGANTLFSDYQYNGTELIITGARLARYFTGAVDSDLSLNGDTAFDMNRYQTYYFSVTKTDNRLAIYDGTYFTAENPLVAYAYNESTDFTPGEYYVPLSQDLFDEYVFYVDGTCAKNYQPLTYTVANGVITLSNDETVAISQLHSYDALKGNWKKSATSNTYYRFDGINLWRSNLSYGEYTLAADNTTYILNDASGAEYARVSLDRNGFLSVTYSQYSATETLGREYGYTGVWDNRQGIVLTLNGLNADGVGTATISYPDHKFSYELTYSLSETLSPVYVCLYFEDTIFGYFTYDSANNVLLATVYDPDNAETGYTSYDPENTGVAGTSQIFSPVYAFDSAWISSDETFESISFNGLGYVNADGDWESTVTVNGSDVRFVLRQQNTATGYFDYNGVRYTLVYDDVNEQILINGSILLQRKDKLADTQFISTESDGTITRYAFDGKGALAQGEMRITYANGDEETYTYQQDGDAFFVYENSALVGEISYNESKDCYSVILNGQQLMYVNNDYIGDWAVQGEFGYDVFRIGPSTLGGNMTAVFHGENVEIETIQDGIFSFECELDGMPCTYYMFEVKNADGVFEGFALTQYSSLAYGDYLLCSPIDEVKGTWVQNGSPAFSISFDGLESSYLGGSAKLTYNGFDTAYEYKLYYTDGELTSVLLWSSTTYNGKTLYYELVPTADVNAVGAFKNADGRAFIRSEADALYKMQATDANGKTYVFNGGNTSDEVWGSVTVSKTGEPTKTYLYDIVSFNANKTATIHLKDVSGETVVWYEGTIDYKNPDNITITLKEIPAPSDAE